MRTVIYTHLLVRIWSLMAECFQFCARVLPTPTIQFSGNQFAKVDPNRVNWMGGKLQYIKPARCKAWYAVAFIVSNQLSESAFRLLFNILAPFSSIYGFIRYLAWIK